MREPHQTASLEVDGQKVSITSLPSIGEQVTYSVAVEQGFCGIVWHKGDEHNQAWFAQPPGYASRGPFPGFVTAVIALVRA